MEKNKKLNELTEEELNEVNGGGTGIPYVLADNHYATAKDFPAGTIVKEIDSDQIGVVVTSIGREIWVTVSWTGVKELSKIYVSRLIKLGNVEEGIKNETK